MADPTAAPSISFNPASIVLDDCMLSDRFKLSKLQRSLRERQSSNKPVDKIVEQLSSLYRDSTTRKLQRFASLPKIEFPEELPVSQKRDDIADAIRNNQVVIVAGETGSGKTTQLPKICLELGRGVAGMIGHTQPRRIAARTVADRIAEELNVSLGEQVGYQVRFTDHSNTETHIKLMTDGILLAEIQRDKFLNRYDTIIVDEAHERSLNIDFLLGYLKQLLPRRPDLKVIVTSATIDVERLSKHFNDAPVVEVSGRTYPVNIQYRPEFNEEMDQAGSIVEIISEINQGLHGKAETGPGDILVFLSGEREIRETALAIRKANLPHIDVLPLYARLSLAEQSKVFKSHRGTRVVLATNVAETSITVPGIRYVIDPGYARVSRYSYRTKVQRLPIEAISQASANQRAGRSGRVAEGVCFRLYEEDDFQQRAQFNDPEIMRSNLASVILQMAQLRIGDIRDFPFVDVPDSRLINDGFKLLEELQALGRGEKLTQLGRKLTGLPVDPKLARMCLAADKFGCLQELLIIVSALTIQDPRERPADKQQASDEKHRRFWDEQSDFVALINLWRYVEEKRQELSNSQFRNLCKKDYLSFMRLREWRDLHHQLRLSCKHLGLKENKEPANYEAVHLALLTGLLGNIGNLNDERAYMGPRNRSFNIFPASSQFKKTPKWIVASELIETTKLYAHGVAKISPEWVLKVADHVVKRQHYEPHYDSKRGQVMAYERISLYGLVLVEKQRVNFSQIDPPLAREIFIRAALVDGKYQPEKRRLEKHQSNHSKEKSKPSQSQEFWQHNQRLYKEVEELEAKSRRRDILAEDRVVFDFFDQRIPQDVVNRRSFDNWRKKIECDNPQVLYIPRDLLMQHAAVDITEAQFPDELVVGKQSFIIEYHFEPGSENDGANLKVPVHALHVLQPNVLEWLVPGLLCDKCIQLVKSLPKQWRKHFVPVPDYIDKAMPELKRGDIPLWQELSRVLRRLKGVEIPDDVFSQVEVEPFYCFNICILNEKGKVIDHGRDIHALRAKYRDRLQTTLKSVGNDIERKNISGWVIGTLAESQHIKNKGIETLGYPALQDKAEHVDLTLFDNPTQAFFTHQRGVVRLIAIALKQQVKYLQKNLFKGKTIGLQLVAMGDAKQLKDDVICAAIKQVICPTGKESLPRDEASFDTAVQQAQFGLTKRAQELELLILESGKAITQIHSALSDRSTKVTFKPVSEDIAQQIKQLTRPSFLFSTPLEWLQQYQRYFAAIQSRIQKSDAQIQKDLANIDLIQPQLTRLQSYWESTNEEALVLCPELATFRWMLEEYRISLFAQPMKTKSPISEKRLDKQWLLAEKQWKDLRK
ncbi:ATP-dependent RNA helicase HrpA [Aurantivibrio plasticivorans]